MIKIDAMKKLSREHRLQSDSLSEITQDYEQALLDLSRNLKLPKRALSHGPFLNALVCQFLAMSQSEREKVAVEAVQKFYSIRQIGPGDEDEDDDEPKQALEKPTYGHPVSAHNVDPERGKKPGRLKRGG